MPNTGFSLVKIQGTIEEMKGVLTIFLTLLAFKCLAQYSLKDLAFLASERNYQEFFQHIGDIRPVKRGKDWQKILIEMAQSYTRKQLALKLYTPDAYKTIFELSKWPILYNDQTFQKLRGEFGEGTFTRCLTQIPNSSHQQCLEQMHLYFDRGQKLPQQALKFLALLPQNSPESFLYIKHLIKNHPSYCAHPLVKKTLLKKLVAMELPRYYKLKSWVKDHLHPDCTDNAGLSRELLSQNFLLATAAFDLLYIQDKLSPANRDFFLTRYYLESNQPGERLNLSWNTLTSLSKNFRRRKKVLDRLKNLDPLPDKLFALKPSLDKTTFMDHLNTNFPEYLDLYSKSCLHYLRGRGPFPNGNPTIHCRQIMNESKGKSWITSRNLKHYYQVKL